jgi:integrin alpha 8
VRIFLQPTEDNQEEYLNEYAFFMAANSSNPEDGLANQDNQRLIRVPVSISTDWRVTGTSKPDHVEYNITEDLPDKYKFEDELGEEVFHVYDVKNRGPSTIQEAEVFILWPSFNDDGQHLLYLLGVEYDVNKVTCQKIDNINPLYVKTFGSRGYPSAQSGSRTSASSGYSSSYSGYSSGGSRGRVGTGGGYSYESSYSSSSSSRGSGGYSGGGYAGRGSSSSSSYGSGQASRGGEQYAYESESNYNTNLGSSNEARIGTSSGGSASRNEYEGSRYGSSTQYRGGNGGHTVVAQGAEETRYVHN